MNEIRESVEKGKAVIGTKETLKSLRRNKLEAVYVTAGCPEVVVESIKKYDKVKLTKIPQNNIELGVLCKKPFPISVLGILKEK